MSKKSRKSKSNGQIDIEMLESADDSSNDNETPQYITTSQLDKILKENQKSTEAIIKNAIKHEFTSMKEELIRLQSELETISGVAENAVKLSDQLKKDCAQLKDENINLKAQLKNATNEQEKTLEIIEENKNRQLRKTLVFKGIPEKTFRDESALNADGTPKSRSENWDDTASILAETIAKALEDTTYDDAFNMVERCHRGAVNSRYKGTAPRPIFAAFLDWRDSERVKEAFRKNNANNNSNTKVFCENKFGPRTTVRRNLALKERKQLIENGQISNGYISHPARLMARETRGGKYKLWRDFSKEPVKFDR